MRKELIAGVVAAAALWPALAAAQSPAQAFAKDSTDRIANLIQSVMGGGNSDPSAK